MSKPEINIPAEFAPDGTKTPFSSSKVQYGFDRLNPDVLAGDNLNQFIDDTYKGLNGVLDLYDEKVNKSGDTMTGDLIIQSSQGALQIETDTWGGILLKNSNIDTTVAPSETQYMGIDFRDKNDTRIGFLGVRQGANSTNTRIEFQNVGSTDFAFGHSSSVDGNWVRANTTVMNNISLKGSTNLTYTLPLPNDGYNYEVYLEGDVSSGNTTGNFGSLTVQSDIVSRLFIAKSKSLTNAANECSGFCLLPVSSSHKIYVERSSGWVATANLNMRGYRRIGTNA